MLCARKEPILPLDRTGMVFLKDGIDRATEQTKILLKIPGTLRKAQTAGSDTISYNCVWLCTYRKQARVA